MQAEAKKVGIREVVGKNETTERLLKVIEALLKEKPSGITNLLDTSPEFEPTDAENGSDTPKLPEPS
jgi:hypothetical protein